MPEYACFSTCHIILALLEKKLLDLQYLEIIERVCAHYIDKNPAYISRTEDLG